MLRMGCLCLVLIGCGRDCAEDLRSDEGTGQPVSITLGVYELVGGCYEDLDKDLELVPGTSCHTWSRTTRSDGGGTGSGLHYNAADDMTYDQVTFTWIEYGPEHSLEDIEALCASGIGGTLEEATWDDYVEQPPGSGAWLRLESVEY